MTETQAAPGHDLFFLANNASRWLGNDLVDRHHYV